jgi:hypothetical protein
MNALNETTAKRIGKLVRMFGSSFENEGHVALAKLKSLLGEEGLSFSDVATVIENASGEIEELKFSESDMKEAYGCGIEKGRVEEARRQQGPPEFYDEDGRPRWNAIALFCQRNHERLKPNEEKFIDEMAAQTMWRNPSGSDEPYERQAKWLLSIFIRLGGRKQ